MITLTWVSLWMFGVGVTWAVLDYAYGDEAPWVLVAMLWPFAWPVAALILGGYAATSRCLRMRKKKGATE